MISLRPEMDKSEKMNLRTRSQLHTILLYLGKQSTALLHALLVLLIQKKAILATLHKKTRNETKTNQTK